LSQLGEGKGVRDVWEQVVKDIRQGVKLSVQQQAAALALCGHFQDAVFCEVTLRGIDLFAGLSCGCPEDEQWLNLGNDAKAISIPRRNMFLQAPWYPLQGDTQVVYGSKFSDRVLVPSKVVRDALAIFTGPRPGRHAPHPPDWIPEAKFNLILQGLRKQSQAWQGCPELADFVHAIAHVQQVCLSACCSAQ
jgi:hypothetical protein